MSASSILTRSARPGLSPLHRPGSDEVQECSWQTASGMDGRWIGPLGKERPDASEGAEISTSDGRRRGYPRPLRTPLIWDQLTGICPPENFGLANLANKRLDRFPSHELMVVGDFPTLSPVLSDRGSSLVGISAFLQGILMAAFWPSALAFWRLRHGGRRPPSHFAGSLRLKLPFYLSRIWLRRR